MTRLKKTKNKKKKVYEDIYVCCENTLCQNDYFINKLMPKN